VVNLIFFLFNIAVSVAEVDEKKFGRLCQGVVQVFALRKIDKMHENPQSE
jgi:hypothetical protein